LAAGLMVAESARTAEEVVSMLNVMCYLCTSPGGFSERQAQKRLTGCMETRCSRLGASLEGGNAVKQSLQSFLLDVREPRRCIYLKNPPVPVG
jgi:hypothetical protein